MMLINYMPLLGKGIGMTLVAWVCAAVGSFTIGLVLGIISSEHLKTEKIGVLIKVYTFVSKGIPAYVQILIAYFVLPNLVGCSLSPFVAASCALAFCSGGYVTEIIRAGINAVPQGQWDAAFVLGYSQQQALHYIILPQGLRTVLPALLGELEKLLKSTSLFATIGVTELTRAGMNIISRELNPTPVYLTIACVYLCFSAVLYVVLHYIQKREMRYGS